MFVAVGAALAKDIDRKLRLTAALLGAVARKDLAAAFRRVNPATSFDIGRADKWLQGRARPRERQIYEDWSKVLGLDRPGTWIAACDLDAFIDELCARHGRDRDELLGLLDPSAARGLRDAAGLDLAGTYVCYSHAWSPYFRGRLMRGALSITDNRADRASASYTEVLPTGQMRLDGMLAVDKRALRIEVSDATRISQYLHFSLFPPSPPYSVLVGLMLGTTLIGPDAQPSVSRIAMIRLPQQRPHLKTSDAYLPPGSSLAADLERLGLPIDDPASVDDVLGSFLTTGGGDGVDQVSQADYRTLVDLFDRLWLVGIGGRPAGGLGAVGGALSNPGEGGSGSVVALRPRGRGRR